jgi:hypothetical protein
LTGELTLRKLINATVILIWHSASPGKTCYNGCGIKMTLVNSKQKGNGKKGQCQPGSVERMINTAILINTGE